MKYADIADLGYAWRERRRCSRLRRTGSIAIPKRALHPPWIADRHLGRPHMQDRNNDEAANSNRNRQPLQRMPSMDDVTHVGRKVLDHNQRHVDDREETNRNQTEKVDAARGLASTQHPDVAREARGDRRRHCGTGCDHQRRDHKNNSGVGKLLNGIIWMAGWREMEMRIDPYRMYRSGKDAQ